MSSTDVAGLAQSGDAGMESYEKNFEKLQEIVRELESGSVSLERGMKLFKEGVCRSNACRKMLEEARHQLHKWQNGEEVPMLADETNALDKVPF